MKRILLLTLFLLMLPLQLQAQNLVVTRHFSGLWEQPEHENHGFTLHIVHQDSGERVAVAFWFMYGEDRESRWFIGQGPVIDDRIELDLYNLSDIGFLDPNDPDVNPADLVGSVVMTFDSCRTGTAMFDTDLPGVGSGSVSIHQFGWIMNTECSGGISDDTPSNVMISEQRIFLQPARGGITGSGHADFEERPDRTEFSVEVEDLTDGVYTIVVGGMDRGDLVVNMGIGETEFRSPVEAGKVLLTFDPRGQVVEVHDGQGAVLSTGDDVFEGGHCQHCDGNGGGDGDGDGDDGDGDDGGGDPMDFGTVDIEVELTSTGVYPQASGDAKLEPREDRTDFSVEIEDVPVGTYNLRIGGSQVATITVVTLMDGSTEGEAEFRQPVEPGKILLDFDPRGQMIEVLDGSTMILETAFPSN
ncbi:MAG: hypothetical protein HKP03_04895 [Xanthomonadales bacterium]|nr:hypothetical protein [Xanthomonadales bacterium]